MTRSADTPLRGADLVARALIDAGAGPIYTLSGNHIMSIFDAAVGKPLELIHTRHEAATVHMADAYGRLTGKPGIAMVTGGPGHANAVGALYTALCAESPMVLLSGHAGTDEIGRGGFQEIRQAEMAAPVAKASWTAASAEGLGADVSRAMALAVYGRPGPVHVSLPSDLLDHAVALTPGRVSPGVPSAARAGAPSGVVVDAILAELGRAERPVIIAGPMFSHAGRRSLLARLEAATGVPVVLMEAVRGLRDATIGAFGDALGEADAVLLLGKPLDFTLKFGAVPTLGATCRVLMVDPEAHIIGRAASELGDRLVLSTIAYGLAAADALISRAKPSPKHAIWAGEVKRLVAHRPPAWATTRSKTPGRVHPLEVFRALAPVLERDADAVLVGDGGEFSQWAQGALPVGRRMINSVAGAIGPGIPSAIAARTVERAAPVISIVGDGTFGFHMAEFDTAVRHRLPFVCIVGNDARWNAEYQIQLRDYGPNRAIGCDLLPTRYDQVVTALGGYGEMIDDAAKIPAAIERAIASGKPACLNVMTESIAAPNVRRSDL
ncbi:MAG TPA: thiamine pyrophosphate-binding protein [Hyphomicrobiaceae bacterium]|nr:thiamine pyrophosphate-binding protein [Hyphomicrobiaceae bacterium]